jgi:copper(I)-binding protein
MKSLILSALLALSATPVLACETFTLGDLTIEHAWSRATIGADRPGVFYVEITNNGSTDDALIGIATPAAGMPMLVPAGQTVEMAPGGYHGMLMGLTATLAEGDIFPVTLTFQNAGEVVVNVEVLSLRAEGPDCDDAN